MLKTDDLGEQFEAKESVSKGHRGQGQEEGEGGNQKR